jgi:hypothetical protein
MYSKTSKPPTPRKRPINWTYVIFVIFGLIMVVGFVVTAIAR